MSSQPHPLVTILTPVFNGERYLTECIQSVLAQTYENWELVIVNNCSTDRTRQIAMEYAARDPRIRVHNNPAFLSLIDNHNNALQQMSPASTYCKILHADDLLLPECLDRMIQLAEEHPSVGIVGAYYLGGDFSITSIPYPVQVTPGPELARLCLLDPKHERILGGPSATLLRSDLIRDQEEFYNPDNLGADREALYRLLRNHDFGFVHQVLTLYRRHPIQSTNVLPERATLFLSRVTILKKYGNEFLSPQEVDRATRTALTVYYRELGLSLFTLRKRDVRNANLQRLHALGLTFSPLRFAMALVAIILDALLNPKSTIEKIVRRVARSTVGRKATFGGKPVDHVVGLPEDVQKLSSAVRP